jgi:hypothetical protein
VNVTGDFSTVKPVAIRRTPALREESRSILYGCVL